MRFKSTTQEGFVAYAVSGTFSVSFAIDTSGANTNDLLGFAVKRRDPTENQDYFMFNNKVFQDLVPFPKPEVQYSSYQYPVQSCVWDDFTTKENRGYEYQFIPVRGTPKNQVHGTPIIIKIKTEPLYSSTNTHDVFFNRGVASSQAYAQKFGNQAPDKIKNKELQKQAFDWLGRYLDRAILTFIANTKKNERLLCCFYEFHYLPVLQELKRAIDRGVKVTIIYDAKDNGTKGTRTKKAQPPFPKAANQKTIKAAKIPATNLIAREANKDSIQHNKFMVRKKNDGSTNEVWFGSTNISEGGIFGQTNVGHWIRSNAVAVAFENYWNILSDDPGMQDGDDAPKRRTDNKAFKESIATLSPDLTYTSLENIAKGETCFFSPRPKKNQLEIYSKILDAAEKAACITLAFGISGIFKKYLKDNTTQDNITFMMLEKKDAPTKNSKNPFIFIGAEQNVYKAYGSYIDSPIYNYVKAEINTQFLGLNTHVKYVHSKFLLCDPLSAHPIVITGSANFSDPSTVDNDEDMILIKGNLRVADIYFTEFNRIFNHYYYRSVYEELKEKKTKNKLDDTARIFLTPDRSWLEAYKPGTLRWKRLKLFTEMDGVITLP